jgi:hypothetical protein
MVESYFTSENRDIEDKATKLIRKKLLDLLIYNVKKNLDFPKLNNQQKIFLARNLLKRKLEN